MASKKRKTVKSKGPRKAADVLRETWAATLARLSDAETEIERQIGLLLKKNKISTEQAQTALKGLASDFDKRRKRGMKELERRLAGLQARVRKERKAFGHMVESAVHRTLVSLNIPSRQEIAELTRKVEELSRKIDRARAKR